MIAIRCKSVGEQLNTPIKCQKCGTHTDYQLNLEKIKRKNTGEINYKIMIDDNYGVKLRLPSVKTMGGGFEADNEIVDIIKSCIESVFDSENVYPFDNETEEEKSRFVESLGVNFIEKLNDEFLARIPKNYIDINFTCPNCGETISEEVDNLLDFFIL